MTCRSSAAILAALALGAPAAVRAQEAPPSRPHIVVLVSDDAGYADFSMHGSRDVATPRIDSIRSGGVAFTQGYVTCSVCSPSRAGLMTGRYQQRFGHECNIPPQWSEKNGLPVEQRTLADELHAVGYRTVAIGKWHLGYAEHFQPLARGFDAYYGFLQGSRPYFPQEQPTRLNRLLRDREPVAESFDYLTDELGREAARHIEQRGDRPLFVYLAFNAVHTPMHALDDDLEGAGGAPRRQKLIAMTRALDRAVGHVLDALDREGIADDTLLFFVNDNGGATNNASGNAPLRGHKGQVFEGGVRVPLLMRWPRGLGAGKVYDQPVSALDILPTCLAAAGAKLPEDRQLDGVDLLPFLRGQREQAPHEALFWRMRETWAVRVGDHKLLQHGDTPPMLFDLAHDAGEQHDLAASQPERVKELCARYEAWASQMVEPRWGN